MRALLINVGHGHLSSDNHPRHNVAPMDLAQCAAILEAAGVRNILTKCIGSNNPHNVVNATMAALNDLVSPEEAAIRRGLEISEMQGRHAGTV